MGGGGEVGGESDVSVGSGGDGGGGVGGGGEGGGEGGGGLDEPLVMESISIMTNIMTSIAQLCGIRNCFFRSSLHDFDFAQQLRTFSCRMQRGFSEAIKNSESKGA